MEDIRVVMSVFTHTRKGEFVMTFVLVRFSVEDFEKWKSVFEETAALRKASGSKGVRAFTKVDSPNEVTILAEYSDLETARQFFQSPELRAAQQSAGLKAPPELSFLDEKFSLPT
jgi:quinol monooxygenase YgiN